MSIPEVRLAFRAGAALLVLAFAPARPVAAQWSTDPAINTPVCTEPSGQIRNVAVSDGAGGVIIAWADSRLGTPASIFAQRFDAAGSARWAPASGVAICTAVGDQDNPAITSDGAGGAIISWEDFREAALPTPPPFPSWDVYAQRVNASGAVVWAADGVLVGQTPPFPGVPAPMDIWSMLAPDGAGGAFIAWESGDLGDAGSWNIYAQRLDPATGAPLWAPLGLPICIAAGGQYMPMLARSGDGVIITWYDDRPAPPAIAPPNIYAQRVSGAGAVLWPVDGALVCGAPGTQTQPDIVSDGVGQGAIITWYDDRGPAGNLDIYAQHVDSLGASLWAPLGLPISVLAGSDQQTSRITTDGAGGAIIAWYDDRFGPADIYAQRVTGAGGLPWGIVNGVAVCSAAGVQDRVKIVSDDAGGAIVSWVDGRNGIDTDIYAQRIAAATGAPLWTLDGVAITTAGQDQWWEWQHICTIADGSGGAVITWRDNRTGTPAVTNFDIYAQRVGEDGTLGGPLTYVNRIGDGLGTFYSAVASAASGSALVGSRQQGGGEGMLVARFDMQGRPLWSREYDFVSGPSEYDIGYAIARFVNGWLVAGSHGFFFPNPGTTGIAELMMLDEEGGIVWALRGPASSEARAILQTQDGNIAVAGAIHAGAPRGYVTKLNNNGGPQWTRFLDFATGLRVTSMVEASDGGLVVAGYLITGSQILGVMLAKLDASGNLSWSRRVTVQVPDLVFARAALAARPDGGFVVATTGPGPQGVRLLVMGFDANGSLQWTSEFDDDPGSGFHPEIGLVADAEGAFACGTLFADVGIVIRLGPSGTAQWMKQVPINSVSSRARALAVVNGGALMAGSAVYQNNSGYSEDLLLARWDTGGNVCLSTDTTVAVTNPAMTLSDALVTSSEDDMTWVPWSPTVAVRPMILVASCEDDLPPPPPTDLVVNYFPAGGTTTPWTWQERPVATSTSAPSEVVQTGGYATLHWSPSAAPDFREYRIHRGETPDFTPDASTLITTQPDTGYTDPKVPRRFYRVGVVDMDGNTAFSDAVMAGGTVGVPGREIGSLWLVSPNPAFGPVRLRWGLPSAGPVKLTIHDVNGRRTRSLVNAMLRAGEHSVQWDDRDESGNLVPSGLYFIRLVSRAGTISRRIVILK